MRKGLLALTLAAAATGAVAVAYLAGRGAQPERLVTPGTTVLRPWALGPPIRRNVPAIPPGGRFCRAADVRLGLTEARALNSATSAAWLVARNTGGRTCVLRGLPAIRIVRQGNGPLTIQEASHSALSEYPPAAPAFGLSPGKEASAQLLLFDTCLYHNTPRSRAVVRLGLVDETTERFPFTMCPQGGTLEIGAWQPPPLPEREHPETWPLDARLTLPSSAVAGRPLSYRVSLRNESDRPFRFPWCPMVWAGIDGGDGAGGGSVLNCGPVGELQPGETVTFPSKLRISRHFRPGRHMVRWGLIGSTGKTPVVAESPLLITGS